MTFFTMHFVGLTGLFKDALMYPGEFGSDTEEYVKESENLYVSRMELWLSSSKKLAVTVLKAALKGALARKETSIKFLKEAFIEQARERVESRRTEKEQLLDRIKELEEENATLKTLHKQANSRYFLAIQQNVEELQHRRQVHHLRKKIDLS
jgi:cell shape-determining protein MreC